MLIAAVDCRGGISWIWGVQLNLFMQITGFMMVKAIVHASTE
jgi:hypothetical protein